MKPDSLLYKYFQLLPEALLLLAGEDEAMLQYASEYHFQSVEVKERTLRFGGLLTRTGFFGTYYFVEVQYRKDKYPFQRIFAGIMLFLHQQHPKGAWRIVVISPKCSVCAGVPAGYEKYLASGRLKVVCLDRRY